MKKIIVLTLFLQYILSSCSSTKTAAGSGEEIVSGKTWYLETIVLPAGNMEVPDRAAFIKFDTKMNSAGGKGGCNSFGSSCTITGKTVGFKGIFSTKMFCDRYQSVEDNFFRLLESSNRYDIKDGKLLLYKDAALLLVLVK